MKKKGFTLVELLAVIVIIALISLIAIPNISGISNNIKDNQMLDDAKKLVALAKAQVNRNRGIRFSANYTFLLDELNTKGDLITDPDGEKYLDGSVKYINNGTSVIYCVYLESKKRKIGNSPNDCVYEKNLKSRTFVFNKDSGGENIINNNIGDDDVNNGGSSGSEQTHELNNQVWAYDLSFDSSLTQFSCNDIQCALEELNKYIR